MAGCPSHEILRQFLADALAEDSRGSVALHIDTCPTCQQVLDQLTPPLLHSTTDYREVEHDPELTRMLNQMRQTVPTSSQGSSAPLQFPGPPTPEGPLGQLGPYQVIRLLGAGATSLVYEARDTRLDRVVAIKVLRPDRAPLASVRERFEREAQALAKLSHEHLVRVYDVHTPEDFPWYLVLEYVAGESLSTWAKRDPKPRQVAQVVREAALGLAAAHQSNLVHRDVKPANILIDDQGRARVADFGLVLNSTLFDTMTMEGQVVGTPAYLSPEQARGEGHDVDARSDVWGLGVVLYELLTGKLPFSGTWSNLLASVVHQEPVRPRSLRPDLSRDLETIVLHCLEKDPTRRYPSAQALAEDLERWLNGEAIRARPLHPLRLLGRWLLRHRVMVGLTMLAAVGLLAGAFAWKTLHGSGETQARNAILLLESRASDVIQEGDEEEGERLLQMAASQVESQVSRYPGLRAEGVRLYQKLADLLDEQDRLVEAEPYLQRGLSLAEAWDREKGGLAAQQAMATLLFRLSESARQRTPPGNWKGYLERFVEVETSLLEAESADGNSIHDLVLACLHLSEEYRKEGQKAQADAMDHKVDALLLRSEQEATSPEERLESTLLRAHVQAHRGDFPSVARLATDLKAAAGDNAEASYQAAACASLCLLALQKQPASGSNPDLKPLYERQALDLLRQAMRLGWNDGLMLLDEAWEPLRDHSEFRRLRRKLRSSLE